ncbi:MAG: glutamate--tRNA ligase family protein [Phycisphaerales bacterium]|jgi:glutamyl-tRNA synthetase|nr:glutamate--tRNA ligase family protein [Phycisphaerales bacterium]
MTPLLPENHPDDRPRTTRLAPSPTGDLHLGNVRSLLLGWAIARARDWRIVLRHEDLDQERSDEGGCEAIESSLSWLGITWDGPALRQSDDLEPYRTAMIRLAEQRRIFASDLSRREIREAAGAPHEKGPVVFPASLRPKDPSAFLFNEQEGNYRLVVEPGTERVRDELQGDREFDPSAEVGDMIVWTRNGRPSYQLAVVVDDDRQDVTDVVRGDDLFSSAARQQRLRRDLGMKGSPRWWHLPMVYDQEGRRLSKRDGDAGILALRDAGVSAERVIGLIAAWAGLIPERCELPASAVPGLTDGSAMRRLVDRESLTPCRFTKEDDRWLRNM